MEMNKILVGVDDGFSQELNETIFNGGVEFVYANLFAARANPDYGHIQFIVFRWPRQAEGWLATLKPL